MCRYSRNDFPTQNEKWEIDEKSESERISFSLSSIAIPRENFSSLSKAIRENTFFRHSLEIKYHFRMFDFYFRLKTPNPEPFRPFPPKQKFPPAIDVSTQI